MAEHPTEIPAAMCVASAAKYLERIADHATNLAEMVVFMVRGKDIRHVGKLERRTSARPSPASEPSTDPIPLADSEPEIP